MSETASLTFLYGEQAHPDLGEIALLPGYRVSFTARGLPDVERDPNMVVPGIVWEGVRPPESPFRGNQLHAVLVRGKSVENVVPVLIRRLRRGGEPGRPTRELMEQVRQAAEACGFPLSWATDGIPLDKVEEIYGKAVAARVRSVADRVSRGIM